jgi:RNA polymerase subunit RPABC4/transcription elongation factor Spt4
MWVRYNDSVDVSGSVADLDRGQSAEDDVFCISCGSVIARDDRYCTECGTDQPVNGEASPPGGGAPEILGFGREYCSDCGAIVETGSPFCGNCGAAQSEDDSNGGPPNEWLIGVGPGLSVQNVAAGVFFYFLLYPIGIPTLVYGYLTRRRRWRRRRAGFLAASIGLVVLLLVYT